MKKNKNLKSYFPKNFGKISEPFVAPGRISPGSRKAQTERQTLSHKSLFLSKLPANLVFMRLSPLSPKLFERLEIKNC